MNEEIKQEIEETPKKKSKVPFIALGSIAAIAIVSLVTVFAMGLGNNNGPAAAPPTTFSAYREAEMRWIDTLVEESRAQSALLSDNFNFTMDFFTEYTPSNALNQMASMFLDTEIPAIELLLEMGFANSGFGYLIEFAMDNDRIPLEIIFGDQMTFAFPGISDYFIYIDMEDEGFDMNEFMAIFDTEAMLYMNESSIETILTIANKFFYDLEEFTTIYVDETVVAEGIEVNATRFSKNLTDEFLQDLLLFTIEEYREFFENFNLDGLEGFDEVTEGLTIIEEVILSEWNTTGEVLVLLNTWIDGRGEIVKRTITTPNNDFVITYIDFVQANDRVIELNLEVDSFTMSFVSQLEERSGAWYGTATLFAGDRFDSIELEAELSGFRKVNGKVYGTITTSGEIEAVSYNLTIELGTRGDSQTITITGNVGVFGMSTDIGELVIGFGIDYEADFSIPQRDQRFAISATDQSDTNFERVDSLLNDLRSFASTTSGLFREGADFIIGEIARELP